MSENSLKNRIRVKAEFLFAKHPNLAKILTNISWLIFDRFFRMGLGLFIGAWIARYLGPEQFGQMNSALALVAIFTIIASLGLDDLVIRDLVRHPDDKEEILGTAFVLKNIGSALSFVLTFLIAYLFYRSDAHYFTILILTALSLLLQSFNVIDLWFQSKVLSKYIVYARNLAFALTSIYKIILIVNKASIELFIISTLIEMVLGLLGMIIVFGICKQTVLKWRFRSSKAAALLRQSWPLIFSGFVVMIYMRSDQIMLKAISGENEVGLYSAAMKISEIWYFIPTTIVASIFPSIIKLRESSIKEYYQRIQNLLSLMMVIALGVSVAITLSADFIISTLYGSEYLRSALVLSIHIWAGIFVFSGIVRGSWLINEGYSKIMFVSTAIGAVVNIALNIFLIPISGAVGASIATVISQCLASYISTFFFAKTRKVFYMQTRALFMTDLFLKLKRRDEGN